MQFDILIYTLIIHKTSKTAENYSPLFSEKIRIDK